MRVLIAPDSFGGTLSPVEAAHAMAEGWLDARPGDEVVLRPMSDGGEGLLDAVEVAMVGHAVQRRTTEVAGPRGLPVDADWLLVDGEVAVIESALACGLALVALERRDPRMTTTWGVGQLIAAAAEAGARRVVLGLGGSATVDGGAGALSGLGWRVTVGDGSGLKIGGEDLPRVAGIAPGWVLPSVAGIQVELLADVRTPLVDAAATFGPQKGADAVAVAHLEAGLRAWADVVEGVFGRPGLRGFEGTGAAGGLGYALVAAHDASLVAGVEAVAALVSLDASMDGVDLVLTGEGRLDATSFEGKVVGDVARRAALRGLPVVAVCGQVADGLDVQAHGLVAAHACPAAEGGGAAQSRLRTAVSLAARGQQM